MSQAGKPARGAERFDEERGAAAPVIFERAPAKLNLYLEVLGRRADGYHELESLVAFAPDVADLVTLRPGRHERASVSGPMASTLEGTNLVDRAVAELHASRPDWRVGTFAIEKNIPVSAGLGGGSADAAAAIRALVRLNSTVDGVGGQLDLAAFEPLALGLGADVPVCLDAPTRGGALMTGIGEGLWRPPDGEPMLPEGTFAVLINPRVPVPTGQVFAALGAPQLSTARECQRSPSAAFAPPAGVGAHVGARFGAGPYASFDALCEALDLRRNDLEPPALGIAPVIAEVLAMLRGTSGCRIARMSGSGATCFGLFATAQAAEAARTSIASQANDWWVAWSRLV